MSKVNTAKPKTQVFAGTPGEIRNVRSFVRVIVARCPVADDAVLLASELATNAVVHTVSGSDGTFCVSVHVEDTRVRVEISDLGSATTPAVRRGGSPGESGAGLNLVDTIAARWGYDGGQRGRVVWFELDWP